MDGDDVLAVVERKTFEGLLADFGRMDILRQRLLELSAFEQHAVVIEAPYAVIWTGWLGRPATRSFHGRRRKVLAGSAPSA